MKKTSGDPSDSATAAPPSAGRIACLHCSEKFYPTIEQAQFCCKGCQFAYRFIQDLKLGKFYSLRSASQQAEDAPSTKPVAEATWDPVFFDHTDFNSRFVTETEKERFADVLVPDLTCYACIWLCENAVAQEVPEARIAINLSDKSAQIRLPKGEGAFSEVVRVLGRLGYEVIPGSSDRRMQLQRVFRMRLGVAILCAINIMLFSAAEYVDLPIFRSGSASLDPAYLHIFRWLQGIFAVPVLTWCAAPFWKGALRTLVTRQLGIDLPIAVSLFSASVFSYLSIFQGKGEIYFDSLTAGVSLLLLGRLIQDRSIRASERALRLTAESQQDWVRLNKDGTESIVRAAAVQLGDVLTVLPGDVLPIRGRILTGKSFYSAERISGEAKPFGCEVGDTLPAQVLNLSSALQVEALDNGAEAYWQKAQALLSQLRLTKAAWSRRSERFASYFFAGVCVVAALCVIYFGGDRTGFERAIAALLIACPCAFGFAIPLTYANSCANALSNGVIFKSQSAFELLSRVKVFVFDKTGTVTLGSLRLMPSSKTDLSPESLRALHSLTAVSQHPASRAIRDAFLDRPEFHQPVIEGANEVLGQGVILSHDGVFWTLGSKQLIAETRSGFEQLDQATSFFCRDGKVLQVFEFKDILDPSAKETLAALKAKGATCFLLTGDSSNQAERVAQELQITVLEKGANPERKLAQIQGHGSSQPIVMVGNGVNDSFALAASQVGIAVATATPAAKQAADIVLTNYGLSGIPIAVLLAKHSLRTVITTFAFAACYNFVGLSLAITGFVQPVLAALLMPVASLTIVKLSMRKAPRFN